MLYKIIFTIILFIGWSFTSAKVGRIILPTPTDLLGVFRDEIFTLNGLGEVVSTLGKFIFSYFFSVFTGILFGIALFNNKILKSVAWPIITSLQATPVISWILLALLWFPSTLIPYFILWIFIFPIMVINTYIGLESTEKKLLEMATIYKVKFKEVFTKIYFPSSLPYLRAGMKISANSSLKVLVTAEIIGRLPKGIGNSMNIAWLNIETASLLGWTIFLVILTGLIEKLIGFIITKIFRRYL